MIGAVHLEAKDLHIVPARYSFGEKQIELRLDDFRSVEPDFMTGCSFGLLGTRDELTTLLGGMLSALDQLPEPAAGLAGEED